MWFEYYHYFHRVSCESDLRVLWMQTVGCLDLAEVGRGQVQSEVCG